MPAMFKRLLYLLGGASLLCELVTAKAGKSSSSTGHSSSGSRSSSSYGSGGKSSSSSSRVTRVSAGTALAYTSVIMSTSSRRRRYGTYNQEDGDCVLKNENEVKAACRRILATESSYESSLVIYTEAAPNVSSLDCVKNVRCCHECMACTTEACTKTIPQCTEFLAESHEYCTNYAFGGIWRSSAVTSTMVVFLLFQLP
eukprot:TRINITY_DN8427_c0_g1_i1.p1 TRINITY_DN8427_c0_g1~~TRINITY_DN8427_c0_g1_i1.p1  ORF type:complete len:199 (+),score=11.99 TRINITY_DN8427_c0_g1_i1:53-649(+)